MRGRKPKPTALKLIAGNPGHRPLNKKEPKVAYVTGAAKPPKWVKGEAKREWDAQIEYLTKTNKILADNELSMLARYCYLHGEFAKDAIAGRVMTAAMEARLEALAASLGIGPSARSRIKTGGGEETGKKGIRSFIG